MPSADQYCEVLKDVAKTFETEIMDLQIVCKN